MRRSRTRTPKNEKLFTVQFLFITQVKWRITFGKIHSSVRASDLLFHLLNSEQQLLYNLLLVVIFILVFFQHLHLLLQLLYLQLELLFLRDL